MGAQSIIAERPERPITHKAEDALGRESFVGRLGDALISRVTGQATGVVMGLTGPWGSGKSSILNLLSEDLKSRYPGAIIVRFDPWLVSARHDLVFEFISELLGTIKSSVGRKGKIKDFTRVAAKYGAHVAPIGNLILPGAGAAAAGSFKAVETALSKSESVAELRDKLIKLLTGLSVPVVVLIDEVDRVEDEEIKTIAQLARSVADFPGISYVLAYDVDRVIQALGGAKDDERAKRGRAYLEKIVQLQIPLPIGLSEERQDHLDAELRAVSRNVFIPADFETDLRYAEVSDFLVKNVALTPRDIKRVVGTYHAIAGMVGQEADWLDVLQYCALLSKAPRTAENVRADPEFFVQDPLSVAAHVDRMNSDDKTLLDQLKRRVATGEDGSEIIDLLCSLFPRFKQGGGMRHADALCYRRPLMTTLRLGLLPGGVSRKQVEQLTSQSSEGVEEALRVAFEGDNLGPLLDRLDEVYVALEMDHVVFWRGAVNFASKQSGWLTEPPLMRSVVDELGNLLLKAAARSGHVKSSAAEVIRDCLSSGDVSISPIWLRRQIMHHGLFRWARRSGEGVDILSKHETEQLALSVTATWRTRLCRGELLPKLWHFSPLFTIFDAGLWDEKCQEAVRKAMRTNGGFDGLSLLLFGSYFVTEKNTLEMLCGYDWFYNRLDKRIQRANSNNTPPEVMQALQKAKASAA